MSVTSASISTSELIAAISAGAAVMSMAVSVIALFLAGRASNLNKNMFRRQSVIDLHMAWQKIRGINPKEPITPDVIRAVSTMDLTASLWLHDVVDRNILCQSYWPSFQALYDSLHKCEIEVPGTGRTGRDFLNDDIRLAYWQMKEHVPQGAAESSL
ncbi:MAG: hypothetical protein GY785_26190 [Gammaproteobacteria bacterium]|nr:hypothetical protein [Gammaproteobacteria bacterium]